MKRVRRLLRLSPRTIAVGYLVFGALWILLSDRLLVGAVDSPTVRAQLQTAKGWLFVLLSGGLIYGLMVTRERQIATGQSRLVERASELNLLHRVFRHNIRNDLNVILGHISLVRADLDDPRGSQQLQTAYHTAERIVEMSEKLRVIERSKVERSADQRIDVVDIIQRELETLRADAPAVTVETELPETALIYGDGALSYALGELLENAVEHFDGPPGDCRVSVVVERGLPTVTVRVTDNGPGIPEWELRALDEDTRDPLLHTSGIGLWLVRWLCQLSEGTVEFESPDDGGTTVTLTFTRAVSIEELSEQARASVEG